MRNVTIPQKERMIMNLLAMFLVLALAYPGMAMSAAPNGEQWGTACKQLDGRKAQKHCCKNKKGECIKACYGLGMSDQEMSECDTDCRHAKSDCQDYVFNK